MQVFAVPIAPDFLGVVLAVLVDGLRAPVVFFARHVRSALNEQDALAAGRQAIGQRSTARARADDDDVKVFVHDGSWSGAGWKPYKGERTSVTAKSEPNDVDIFLLMEDSFDVRQVSSEARLVFDHAAAQNLLGASVFWIRRAAALGGEDATISHWQIKRDGNKRGIVELTQND